MKRILFVCTGNTCRSPMAVGLAQKILHRLYPDEQVEVASAGLSALSGMPISMDAAAVLEDEGIDLRDHKAVQLSIEQVRRADLIFAMTASQKCRILELFPEAGEKVFILKEFGDPDAGVKKSACFHDLFHQIQEKKDRFQAAYGQDIERLEQERAGIFKRLQAIEGELGVYRDLLDNELRPEQEKIRDLKKELAGYDIRDPYGQPRTVYKECAAELAKAIEAVCRRLAADG